MITIETFHYPNDIYPGVYDIHSPRVLDSDEMANLLRKAAKRIPVEQLWANTDCVLKPTPGQKLKPP